MRRLILCVGLLAGCGAPGAPTPTTPSIAGTWQGSYGVVFGARVDGASMTATLNQDAAHHVTGTWVSLGGTSRGTVDGQIAGVSPDARFTGTFTITAPSADPSVRCEGTAQIAGTVEPIRWEADRLVLANCSGNPTNLIVTLRR